ncbi:hypothetical protein [Nitrosovibrio sp. Nv6]|uniref:hypothetical protein n=1 Tax=Nitrosovibrio sp. Nv6 TaxID=1855340 RepID=UPI0008C95084|nr:hypothetical protein [Nitrosovibrio sp. Nv6]SEO79050.1 hypothetical protein SAMN05216316_1109 [Nitrosovibrio sp. Nv6]
MIRLTAEQIQKALKDLIGDAPDQDDLETEVCFEYMTGRVSHSGERMPDGTYYWMAEYPEEGVFGPIEMSSEELIAFQEEYKVNS